MGIQVHWDHQLTHTIVYTYKGAWTWQEYRAAFEDEIRLAGKLNCERYDVIFDFSRSPVAPAGSAILPLKYSIEHSPQSLKLAVMVACNDMVRIFINTGLKFVPRMRDNTFFVDTIDNARQIITQDRRQTGDICNGSNTK